MEVKSALQRRRAILLSAGGLVLTAVILGVVMMARNGGAGTETKKKKDAKEDVPPAPVELTEVRSGDISTWLTTTTTLECRNVAAVVARRAGQIMAIPAEEGQWVRKGDLLAQLDDTEARLEVERNDVEVEMARKEMERAEQVHNQGFLSDRELDDRRLKSRSAGVVLEQARHNLSETRVVAPFSGRVTDRLVNLGESVQEGRECFRMADFDPMLARLHFPEKDLGKVQLGQEATVVLDAYPGREFTGRVSLVNPVVDRTNGTFKVTLEIPNPDGTLRLGAFARVKLQTGSFDRTLLMPRRGLLSEDGEDYVFVAQGDSVVKTPVTIGAVEGDVVQVLSGLAGGAKVVTVGQGGLKPGDKIKVVSF